MESCCRTRDELNLRSRQAYYLHVRSMTFYAADKSDLQMRIWRIAIKSSRRGVAGRKSPAAGF
jgi:hypothetical protein